MPRPKSPAPITFRQLTEFKRLRAEHEELRFAHDVSKAGLLVDGMGAVLARRLMSDVARLISREPGNRALLRLPATGPMDGEAVKAALADAEAALDAFERAHWRSDDTEPGWVMAEEDVQKLFL